MNALRALQERVAADRARVAYALAELATRVAALEAELPARLDGFERRLDDLGHIVTRRPGELAKWATLNAAGHNSFAKRIGRLELAAKV